MKRILVIDGNSIVNRAFYGIKLLTTKDGQFTNGIYGFMNILIIGATSGIGRGLWDTYAKNDNNVIVLGRRISLLEEMKEMRPTNTTIYPCDITNHHEFESILNDVCNNANKIDLAIICAGTGDLNPDLSIDIELSTINTNIVGWTTVVDSIYNLFKKQGFGHLVTITSIGGLVGEPNAPAYSATKAYQINYSQALRKKIQEGWYLRNRNKTRLS